MPSIAQRRLDRRRRVAVLRAAAPGRAPRPPSPAPRTASRSVRTPRRSRRAQDEQAIPGRPRRARSPRGSSSSRPSRARRSAARVASDPVARTTRSGSHTVPSAVSTRCGPVSRASCMSTRAPRSSYGRAPADVSSSISARTRRMTAGKSTSTRQRGRRTRPRAAPCAATRAAFSMRLGGVAAEVRALAAQDLALGHHDVQARAGQRVRDVRARCRRRR